MEPLSLPIHRADWDVLKAQTRIITEAFAETEIVEFKQIRRLRRLFKQEGMLRLFTVNDILTVYRALHTLTYKPSGQLMRVLDKRPFAKDITHAAHHRVIIDINVEI